MSRPAHNRRTIEPGTVFGKLTVMHSEPTLSSGRLRYECLCTCGVIKLVLSDNLKRGKSVSCGCMRNLNTSIRSSTHGMSSSPIYAVWNMMMQRCYVENYRLYKDYGGRGITVDPAWHKFENFYQDVGDIPFKGASLERKDNNLGYCKTNVEWANRFVQSRNKRNNRKFAFNGENLLLPDWAVKLGINKRTLASRLYIYKWSVEKAFTTPVRKQ